MPSVRVLPYTSATLVGVLPGAAAVVILGDALTGDVSPMPLLVSLCTGPGAISAFGLHCEDAIIGSGKTMASPLPLRCCVRAHPPGSC